MSYIRVIPRDLFNESKLLKCLGRLALQIHERAAPDGLAVYHNCEESDGFKIQQDKSDGGLFVANLVFTLPGKGVLTFKTLYSSKLAYPLIEEQEGVFVFDDSGYFSSEFLDFCNVEKEASA
jgi:hypothetical protein